VGHKVHSVRCGWPLPKEPTPLFYQIYGCLLCRHGNALIKKKGAADDDADALGHSIACLMMPVLLVNLLLRSSGALDIVLEQDHDCPMLVGFPVLTVCFVICINSSLASSKSLMVLPSPSLSCASRRAEKPVSLLAYWQASLLALPA
jgi:hypothetical protein